MESVVRPMRGRRLAFSHLALLDDLFDAAIRHPADKSRHLHQDDSHPSLSSF